MWGHDHDVRADVEIVIRGMSASRSIRHPRADVHVSDADAFDLRRGAGETVLHPLQKDAIETTRLVVRIARNGRETAPLAGAFAQHPILSIRLGRPVENRRVLRNKLWPGPQGVGGLFGIGNRKLWC